MYIYNNFVFGHDLSKEPELNNETWSWDITIHERINNRLFEIDFPYHGGQCKGNVYSCIFGTIITDSDPTNKNFAKEVRSAKEEDYIDDYKLFISKVKSLLIEDSLISDEDGFPSFLTRLFNFIDSNEPEFYMVEVSS